MNFLGWLESNWDVISQSPIIFISFAVLVFGITYAVTKRLDLNKIEALQERLKLAQDRERDYRDKLEGASPEEAKRNIVELQLKVEGLVEQLAALQPLRISPEKRKEMSAILSGSDAGKVQVVKDGTAGDMNGLQSDLSTAFSAAGWEVSMPIVLGPGFTSSTGILVSFPAGRATDEIKASVIAALDVSELKYQVRTDAYQGVGDSSLEILLTSPAAI